MKRKNFIAKRIIAGTMTLAMIVGTVPQMAFAADLTVDDAAAVSVSDSVAAQTVEAMVGADGQTVTASDIAAKANGSNEITGNLTVDNVNIGLGNGCSIKNVNNNNGKVTFTHKGVSFGRFKISLANEEKITKVVIECDSNGTANQFKKNEALIDTAWKVDGNKVTWEGNNPADSISFGVSKSSYQISSITVKGDHEHSYTVTLSDGTITGTCNCGDNWSVKLNAPTDLTYDGNPKEATVTTTGTEGEKYKNTTITYTDASGNAVNGAPVNAGTYKASITVGEKTATVEFTIAKATQTINASDITVEAGKTANISASTNPDTGAKLSYASNDTSKATVDTNGTVSGVAEGTATITVTASETDNYNSATAEINVTVTSAEITPPEEYKHEHDWTYSADGSTLTATCGKENCTLPENKISLTLKANDKVYDGENATAYFEESEKTAWTEAGLTLPKDVTYVYRSKETDRYAKTSETKKVGYYKATTNIQNVEKTFISTTFKITPKSLNDCEVTVEANPVDKTQPIVTVKDPALDKVLEVSKDYIDERIYNEGKISIAVTGQGNYKDTVNEIFTQTFEQKTQTITANDIDVAVGSIKSINATTDAGDAAKLTYVSSDPTIATVDDHGVVTGVKKGTTTITIKADAVGDYEAAEDVTINVTVVEAATEPTKPTKTQCITAKPVTVIYGTVGKKINAKAKGDATLTYELAKASLKNVISVDETTGEITTINAGSAFVKVTAAATSEYKAATATVLVTVRPKTLTYGMVDTTIEDGKLVVKVTDGDKTLQKGKDYTLTTCYNKHTGKYTIVVRGKGNYIGIVIKEYKPEDTKPETPTKAEQTIEAADVSVTFGDTNGKINAEVTAQEGKTTGALSYEVAEDSKDIIDVDENGNITTKKVGTATVTIKAAETDDCDEAEKIITVTVGSEKFDQHITASDITLTVGDTVEIGATTEAGENAKLRYNVVNGSDVAELDKTATDKSGKFNTNGKITGLKVGTAEVRIRALATDEYNAALEKTITVTVKEKENGGTSGGGSGSGTGGSTGGGSSTGGNGGVYVPSTPAHQHDLEKIEAKEPTYDEEGNIEYYHCKDNGCDKYFSDPEGKYEITKESTVIAKLTKPQVEPEPVQPGDENLSLLLCKGIGGNHQIKLTWLPDNNVDGYDIFGTECYTYNFKLIKGDLTKLSYTIKNLKNSKAYKYYVKSYKLVNGEKVYQSKSAMVHVAMTGQKCTNVKTLTVKKASYKIAAGSTENIRASVKKENSKKKYLNHASKYRYFTDNKKIATVSKSGEIKAKSTGNCKIYVLAENGVYKTVKVTVK